MTFTSPWLISLPLETGHFRMQQLMPSRKYLCCQWRWKPWGWQTSTPEPTVQQQKQSITITMPSAHLPFPYSGTRGSFFLWKEPIWNNCITQTWKSIVENEGRVEEEYRREDPWVKCCSFRSSNFTIHVGRQNAERSQQTCCKCWWCHNWRPNELTWPIWVVGPWIAILHTIWLW